MLRRLFTLLSAVSLVLCLGAGVAGVVSFSRADKLEYVSPAGRLVLLISKSGRLDVLYHGAWTGEPGFTHIPTSPSTRGGTDYGRRLLGFGAGTRPNGASLVNVPYWFLAASFAVPPVLTIRARVRRRRGHGLCPSCSYDLRATPGRCPECGMAAGRRRQGGRADTV